MSWSTANEKDFLKFLGNFTPAGRRAGRLKLLHGYLNAAEVRENWGMVDKTEIISDLKEKIREEEGQ